MLKFAAVNEESIPLLDTSGRDARRFYFVRRTLGTLSELRGAFAVLKKNQTFQERKSHWALGAQAGWDASVAFFNQIGRDK